ncbi:MAG: ABC transporter permease [Acidimicrobiales bacterium]
MNAHTVRLVATRELRERGRARSYRVTLLLSVVAVVAAIVLPKALAGPNRPLRLGVIGAPLPIGALEKVVGRSITVTSPPSASAARTLVQDKQLDLAVVGDEVVVRDQPKPADTSATSRLAYALASASAAKAAGLTSAQIVALADPLGRVTALRPPKPDRTRRQVTTLIGIVLIWSSIQLYGTWILFGVIEEKSSRIVEILLATVETAELLAGKVIGIGLLALAQMVCLAVASFTASTVSGANVLRGASGASVLGMLGWFALGYAFYSSLFAAGGSLVGRQEEAQNVQFPITLPLLIAYIASFNAIFRPAPPFVVALSFLPPTSPIAMPARIAGGNVPAWQIGVSVALLVIGTLAAIRVAARVYDRAILRTGGRVTWRAALAASGR